MSEREGSQRERAQRERAQAPGEPEPVQPPWGVLPDYQCFGCSPHNPAGLQLRFWESVDGDGLEAPLDFGRAHESYPGVVHGGIVATVCDEIMGNLLVLRTGVTHFTVTLRTRFLAPLAVGTAYRCVATVRSETGASGQRQAAADVLDETGRTVASATGTYQPASAEAVRQHFALSDADRQLLDGALSTSEHTSGRDRG